MLPPNPAAAGSPTQNGIHPASHHPHVQPGSPEPNGLADQSSHAVDPTQQTLNHANGYSNHEHWEVSQPPFPAGAGLGLGLRCHDAAGALEPAARVFSEESLAPDGQGMAAGEDEMLDKPPGFATVALDTSGSPTKQPRSPVPAAGNPQQNFLPADGKLVQVSSSPGKLDGCL